MTRNVYLHVGMPKCASTTIQSFLAHAARALSRQGLHYRFHPGHDPRYQGNAARLAWAIRHERRTELDDLLDFHLGADGDVILSAEMLTPLARSRRFARVASAIRDRGFRITVLCFLRRQDHWIESSYKQIIKSPPPAIQLRGASARQAEPREHGP